MPSTAETLADVKSRIRLVLSFFADEPLEAVDDTDDLRDDLGLGEIHIRALAKPLTHMSRSHGGLAVTQKECTECATVADCDALVIGKLP